MFCFVDRVLNRPELGKGKYFTAKEMFENFIRKRKERSKQGEHLNVIRLSGGEAACLIPELIVDIHDEIEKEGLSNKVYLWVDCNLSTAMYLQNLRSNLGKVAKKKNFGIVGCLKTPGDGQSGQDDFSMVTGCEPSSYLKQFKVLDFLVKSLKADTYVYLVPYICGDTKTCHERLYLCAKRLEKININLPLRTNIIRIRRYTPTKINIESANKEGRIPHYSNYEEWFRIFEQNQRLITKIWYHETIPKLYAHREIEKYRHSFRCQVPIYD